MRRTFIHGAALVALITGPTAAQSPQSSQSSQSPPSVLGVPFKTDRPLTEEEIEKRKATDRAYNAAIQKIPDKKPPADPWGDVRPNSPAASKNR